MHYALKKNYELKKNNNKMEKKPYETPAIEVIDLPETPSILQASNQRSAPMYFDDGEFN